MITKHDAIYVRDFDKDDVKNHIREIFEIIKFDCQLNGYDDVEPANTESIAVEDKKDFADEVLEGITVADEETAQSVDEVKAGKYLTDEDDEEYRAMVLAWQEEEDKKFRYDEVKDKYIIKGKEYTDYEA